MMQKIQRFGGAMFPPVLLFAFAGICIGVGTLFTTEAIMGNLASTDSFWYQCWNVILQGGWTVFNQLPLLFVVGLPIGLAKKQNARCCMEAIVLFLTFHYFLSTILSQWGANFGVDFAQEVGGTSGLTMVANIKTLDMGMIGALLISGIVIMIHNRYFDTKLPEWLGTFSGSSFVVIIGFFVMIPVAILSAILWPQVQNGLSAFQGFIVTTGAFGVWVFILLERLLIPFGLHHLLYSPFYYDSAVVAGGLYSHWANMLPILANTTQSLKSLVPEAGFTLTGLSKMFGCPGIALAFYATAKSEKKKQVAGLLIPITLTAIVCGVTEPIEFTFLFIAPALYVVHCVLAATLATISYMAGVVGIFSGGAIESAALNWIPLFGSHWSTYLIQFAIGIAFTGIYFIVFRTLILKFDFKTPGREVDSDEVKFYSKKEFRERNENKGIEGEVPDFALLILDGLGGKDNILDVTNCATRLRVNVKDESLVQDDPYFKSIGAHGLSANGKAMQVIIGLQVAHVRDDFESLL
jgi:PTS system arbutin-like IIC component